MEETVYLNGSLMPRSQARIAAFDYGFLYGYGLFETMRAYSGHIFRLGQHLDRLAGSAKLLGIDLEPVDDDLAKAVYATLRANSLGDARVRLTISGGEGDAIPELAGSRSPTVFIAVRPRISSSPQEGVVGMVSSLRRNSRSPLCGVKSLNYLENIFARREAKAAGAHEAVLLNEEDFLSEASMSNVFFVSGDTLVTPDESSGLLPGITRRVVMELAASARIHVAERCVRLEELLRADEAFLTNSVVEIVPLVRVGDRVIGSGSVGEITRLLKQAYTGLVRTEIDGSG